MTPPTSPSSWSGRCRWPAGSSVEHEVLQKVLETEPDRLNALITVQQHRVIGAIAAYFLPLLRARPRGGPSSTRRPTSPRCAEYVARLSLSLIASPGRHDLGDPAEVHRLVRRELLGGVWS